MWLSPTPYLRCAYSVARSQAVAEIYQGYLEENSDDYRSTRYGDEGVIAVRWRRRRAVGTGIAGLTLNEKMEIAQAAATGWASDIIEAAGRRGEHRRRRPLSSGTWRVQSAGGIASIRSRRLASLARCVPSRRRTSISWEAASTVWAEKPLSARIHDVRPLSSDVAHIMPHRLTQEPVRTCCHDGGVGPAVKRSQGTIVRTSPSFRRPWTATRTDLDYAGYRYSRRGVYRRRGDDDQHRSRHRWSSPRRSSGSEFAERIRPKRARGTCRTSTRPYSRGPVDGHATTWATPLPGQRRGQLVEGASTRSRGSIQRPGRPACSATASLRSRSL